MSLPYSRFPVNEQTIDFFFMARHQKLYLSASAITDEPFSFGFVEDAVRLLVNPQPERQSILLFYRAKLLMSD